MCAEMTVSEEFSDLKFKVHELSKASVPKNTKEKKSVRKHTVKDNHTA